MLSQTRLSPSTLFKIGLGTLLSGTVIAWRFRIGTPTQALAFQVVFGYWWMWAVLGALIFSSLNVTKRFWADRTVLASMGKRLWSNHKWGGLLILICGGFLHVHEPHEFKVLYDEPSHLQVSQVMFMHRQALAAGRTHYIGDNFVAMNTYPQFRQCFFAFTLYLLHCIFGYSPFAPFVLNFLITFALLGAIYALAHILFGRFGAGVSVLLMTAVPLLAQNVTSAGYDVYNLFFIALVPLGVLKFLSAVDEASARPWLNWTAALILVASQVRYESILYFALIVGLILLRWYRQRGEIVVTWFLAFVPIFLLPAFASNLYYLAAPNMMLPGLRTHGEAFFGTEHIKGHLQDLLVYLFEFNPTNTASVLVSYVGCLAIILIFARLVTSKTLSATTRLRLTVLLIVTVSVLGVYAITLMNFWSSPLDGLAARFSLPLWFCLAIAGGWLITEFASSPRKKWLCCSIVTWSLVVNTSHANSTHDVTTMLTPSRSEKWFLEFANTRERATTLFVSKSNVQLMAFRFAAIDLDRLNAGTEHCLKALQAGIYKEIYILERSEFPLTARGPNPDALLIAKHVVVEEVARRSFAPGQLSRIVRLVGYRSPDGKVITKENLPPIPPTFETDAKRDAFIFSLYP